MYHSKITGKGRITHYDAELNSAREYQVAIENDIRHGLENNEFEVWYQPIVCARTQVMIGVEALVRWPRRKKGELMPDAFIAVAETSGLIYALGQFVLARACHDLLAHNDLKLSVNISPAQFRDPEFENKVSSVLKSSGFPPSRLQLEVTETYVLEKPERARAAIANLKALGTAVALDDFGTGYSSIGYLRRFNFDTIKIDKSLAGWWMTTIRLLLWWGHDSDCQRARHDGDCRRRRNGETDEAAAVGGLRSASGILFQRADAVIFAAGVASPAASELIVGGERFQLVAKTGDGDGAVVGTPAIFGRRC